MNFFLSILAATGIVGLGHITKAWTSGLENSITIEIPAANVSEDEVQSLLQGLLKIEGVQKRSVLAKGYGKITPPWFGNVSSLWEDLPIPALITVTISERNAQITSKISVTTRKISPNATVDAHDAWLSDLLKLANGLRLVSLGVFV